MYHWKDTLDEDWIADPAIFHPDFEDRAVGPLMPYFAEPAAVAQGNLGRGTFVYRGLRSRHILQISLGSSPFLEAFNSAAMPSFPTVALPNFLSLPAKQRPPRGPQRLVSRRKKRRGGEQALG